MEINETILEFWFKDIKEDSVIDKDSPMTQFWFGKNDFVDDEIRRKFQPNLHKAWKGRYDDWLKEPRGSLALIILLDQFPRNIFRGSAKAFDYDLKALECCLKAVKENKDEELNLFERQFLYLPLMHAENLKIQEKSLQYFEQLLETAKENRPELIGYFEFVYSFAQKHYNIIRDFGRFPHRNELLNRRSVPAEKEFLSQPGSSF